MSFADHTADVIRMYLIGLRVLRVEDRGGTAQAVGNRFMRPSIHPGVGKCNQHGRCGCPAFGRIDVAHITGRPEQSISQWPWPSAAGWRSVFVLLSDRIQGDLQVANAIMFRLRQLAATYIHLYGRQE